MIRQLLLSMLVASAPLQLSAVERSEALRSKVAVLIDTDVMSVKNVSPGFNAALALAIRNYSDYYLSRAGLPFEIFLLDPGISFEKYQQGVRLSDYRTIVRLRPVGRLETHAVAVRDQRRHSRFVKVSGFLDLTIRCTYLSIEKGQVVGTRSRNVHDAAQRYWLTHPIYGERWQLDSLLSVNPEPFEHIIERCVQEALDPLGGVTSGPKLEANPIPTVVLVDSSYIMARPGRWKEVATETLDETSRLFYRSFSRTFRLARIDPIKVAVDGELSLPQIHTLLKLRMKVGPDTLAIVLVQSVNPAGYFLNQEYETIGVSDIGQKSIIVSALPATTKRATLWEPYVNGLTLLHEIGHSLGAIHVSDINSVMSHSTSWLASAGFDPFNRRIIEAALSGDLTFDDPVAYLSFVSRTLKEVRYPLVDYPAFFYRFLSQRDNKEIAKELRAAVARQAFLTAADAYGNLAAGERNKAARLFREALESDPDQAALYYYLAKATGGEEARAARSKAAYMGYFMAVMERGMALAGTPK